MNYRIERINSEMLKSLSDIIRNRLKDPRVSELVSVLRVDCAKDLQTAKIYVSIYGDKDKKKSTFDGLKNTAGFIRRELSKDFNFLHSVPELTFLNDDSAEYSQHINSILEEIKKQELENTSNSPIQNKRENGDNDEK